MLCPSAELSGPRYAAFVDRLKARGLSVEPELADEVTEESAMVVRRGRAKQRFYIRQAAGGRYHVSLCYDLTWPWRWPAEARVYDELFDLLLQSAEEDSGGGERSEGSQMGA